MQGKARLEMERQGKARSSSMSRYVYGKARKCKAWKGKERHGMEIQVKERLDMARHGKARSRYRSRYRYGK
jgi:hypothetical protein